MPETRPKAPLRGRRILVVEDDWFMAQDLAAALAEAGAEPLGPVPDIEGALAALRGAPAPDAVVLDINLGGKLVYPLVDALRSRGIRLLFATGYDEWSIPAAYRDLPRIEKPLDVKRIAEALAT